MPFNFRWLKDIQPSDASKLKQLLTASIQDDGMLGFDESDSAMIDDFLTQLAAKRAGQISQVLLIEDGRSGQAAATVVFTQVAHKTSRHLAELSKVIIAPGFRGTGLLQAGLDEVCQKALSLGVSRFFFDVREGTASAKLWHALGFETYGRLADYSHYKGETHAGLFMTASIEDLRARSLTKKGN
ncbi:GNAT family N-acetyltransferase [Reinekea sp.]|uniref:GNAT family N-acetyltransferase n=1 Tax=Reinekea sp. TaxID=1970455 RepID=UPI002A80D187|nr:GNAT family N-acetyltransferase [Reinekea sp.]